MFEHRRSRSTLSGPTVLLAAVAIAVGVLALGGTATDVGSVAGTVAGRADPGEGPGAANGSITVAADDAAFMDRIYGSQNDEVVYCGRVADGRLTVMLAEMVARGDDFAEFRPSSCADGRGALANVHTHPGGAERLSATDRDLLTGGFYRYVCIQHAAVVADGLSCYESVDGGVARIDVAVER